VDTYAIYKVEVYAPDSSEALGSDTQGVTDTTDPYLVQPNPTPSDETIEEDSGGKITYTPKIVSRSGVAISTQPNFDFYATDSKGNYRGSATNATSYSVTEDMCSAGDSDVTLVITSKEF
jgi:hypothetical protein